MDEKVFDPAAFATRLRELIYPEKYGSFAQRAGISLTVLNKYMAAKDGMSPSIDVIVRICQATRSSIDWLILGDGDGPIRDDAISYVPIYDGRLAAGDGALTGREQIVGQMPIDRELLKSLGLPNADDLGVMTADGDSMEPLISDGARVLISFANKRLTEGVFAFRLGDNLRIKRLRPVGLGGVEAISENPIYPPERLSGDEIEHFEIIGRALWAGTLL